MDLFYRLNVVPLYVLSLAERLADIPLLAEHFLCDIVGRTGRALRTMDADAIEFLRTREFSGNVWQLRNVLEGASVFAVGPTITKSDVEQILENGSGLSRRASQGLSGGADPFAARTFEEFKDQSEALFFQLKLA